MNIQELDILNTLNCQEYLNQRTLSEMSGHSIGIVNRSLKNLLSEGYINEDSSLKEKAKELCKENAPKNAVILAAGYGMRMVPINTEIPKGLLTVKGERLIERIIKQLKEAGVNNINIVVGFMKEKYEYLIEKYNVNLIINEDYTVKNNLYSFKSALPLMGNTYIVPCDIWCEVNPFKKSELLSWYMMGDEIVEGSNVTINRRKEIVRNTNLDEGNRMVGIAYILEKDLAPIKENVDYMTKHHRFNNVFWEDAAFEKNKMFLTSKVVNSADYIEINTYEQLRELDNNSKHLKTEAIDIIKSVLNARDDEIVNITTLKKGMTNRSFLFECKGEKYIMRIPGEGTDHLINRAEEASVYTQISDKNICDDIKFIDPSTGYKITKYFEGARCCDPESDDDLKKCMKKLKDFHELKLKVDHEFNIYDKIEFYETLWEGAPSVYEDYKETKEKVYELKQYIDENVGEKSLTHIDAVPDNFLFVNVKGNEEIRLIDWEYAAMQDIHVDIAMFCIYALYDKEQCDHLIDIYFDGNCPENIRTKIYCYIAACGLLWSNWCEYKRALGVEFGEYSIRQYMYAKEFYRYAKERM